MANLQDLPPELIAMITANLDFGSHMNLMLASKTLFSMVLEVRPTQRQEWINFNLKFEHHVPPRRVLPILTCTLCAKLHPRAMFSDSQKKKTNPTRFCIKAGIIKKKYHGYRRTFRVGGVVMFGCFGCRKARPVAEGAPYCPFDGFNVRFCGPCCKAADAYLESGDILLLTRLRRALTYHRQGHKFWEVRLSCTKTACLARFFRAAGNAYWKLSLR